MSFSEEIKKTRMHCFLTQEAFAKELNVSFSTVNRWEGGRAKPNLAAMKNLKSFCEKNNLPFAVLEEEWLKMNTEENSDG